MGLIKRLYESGDLKLYQDFRTGSYDDMSPFHSTVTPIANIKITRNSKGCHSIGLAGSNFSVFTDQSNFAIPSGSGGMIIMARVEPRQAGWVGFHRVFSCSTYRLDSAAPYFRVYSVTDTAESAGPVGYDAYTIAARVVASSPAFFYVNGGPRYTGTNTLNPATPAGVSVNTAYPVVGSQPFPQYNALVCSGENVTDADIYQLHKEMMSPRIGVTRRPRRSFSLPYPAKTPAEYAAEGITFDSEFAPVAAEVPADEGTAGVVVGTFDVRKGGPFDQSLNVSGFIDFDTLQGEPSPGNGSFACAVWAKRNSVASPSPKQLFGKYNGIPLWDMQINSANQFTYRARSVSYDSTNINSALVAPIKWIHAALIVDRTNNVMSIALDGILAHSTSIAGMGTETLANLNKFVFGAAQSGAYNFDGEMVGGRFFNGLVSPDRMRSEYLKGARKCVLDGAVRADGSCPVTLSAATVGDEIANGWRVTEGTWAVRDIASVGRAAVEETGSGNAVLTQELLTAPYGSWYFKADAQTGAVYLSLGSTVPGRYSEAGQTGYWVSFSTRVLQIGRTNGGVWSVMFYTPITSAYLREYWVTRRLDGTFDAWVKGGPYTQWTRPAADGSSPNSLPFADTIITTPSKYQNIHTTKDLRMYDWRHFLGEMTPAEAMQQGVLSS